MVGHCVVNNKDIGIFENYSTIALQQIKISRQLPAIYCFTEHLPIIYRQVYPIQFVDQLYLNQLLTFLDRKSNKNIAYL